MPRINPPGPRYTIPSGTEGLVSRFDSPGPRPHRTRSELGFAYPYCFHGPGNPVFRVKRDWLFAVPLARIEVRDYRVIAALLFSLEGTGHQCPSAWPDEQGNSPYAWPKRRSHTRRPGWPGD